MLLHEKVIIVTGAGGGLGEGIARVCHREGARVVSPILMAPARPSPPRSSHRPWRCMRRAPGRAIAKAGRPGGRAVQPGRRLVNNAGINCVKPLLETTPDDWQNVLADQFAGSLSAQPDGHPPDVGSSPRAAAS